MTTPTTRTESPRAAVASATWSLWSTTAVLVVTDETMLPEATRLVRAHLAEVELAASRFRDDSEIRRLAEREDGDVVVSDVLADLLTEALLAARRTDGRVDPTVGTAMRRIGYDRDIELVLRDGAPVSAVVKPVPGWQRIRLTGNRLRMPRAVELDLGATAKAVAADRCASLVAGSLGTGVLVSLGGDIATAGPTPPGGWRVTVQDRPEDAPASVTLGPGDAIATSSTVTRAWSRGDRRLHHIVDPATGLPAASPWRSVTVAAATCVEANTASTASLVMGEDALGWLTELGLPARLLRHDGTVVALDAWSEAAA
jgi:thiamine biosynthesis lipoprotein